MDMFLVAADTRWLFKSLFSVFVHAQKNTQRFTGFCRIRSNSFTIILSL